MIALETAQDRLRFDPTTGCLISLRSQLAPDQEFIQAQIEPIQIMHWQEGGRDHHIPAIFHAVWRAPDGRVGWTIANWTNEMQALTITDARLGDRVKVYISSQQVASNIYTVPAGRLMINLPPLSCLLVESPA